MLIKTVETLALKVFKMIHLIRNFKMRKLGFSEFKIKAAHIRNKLSVIDRFRYCGKKLAHLVFTFQIKLLRFKFKPGILADNVVRLNTD